MVAVGNLSNKRDGLWRRMTERFSRPVAEPQDGTSGTGLHVTVTRGRHKGATADIVGLRASVGQALDCDIVLTDANIASRHVILDFTGTPGSRSAVVTAGETGAVVAGHAIQPGVARTQRLPLQIDVGDATIEITDRAKTATRALNMTLAIPLAVGAGAGIGTLLTWGSAPDVVLPSARPQAPIASTPRAAPTIALPDVARQMDGMLATAGLQKQIKLTQRDNVILAEGTLPLDAFAKWRQIKAAVRESTSDRIVIADVVKPGDTSAGPANMIASVSNGKVPFVTGSNGKRAAVGEPLADGWIVRHITPQSVLLERGTAKMTIKLDK